MKQLLFVALMFVIVGAVNAQEHQVQCGERQFRVEASNQGTRTAGEYRIVVQEATGNKLLYVSEKRVEFAAGCVRDKSGKELLVFEMDPAGPYCKTPRTQLGIIDPKSLQWLLKPWPTCSESSNHYKLRGFFDHPISILSRPD